MLNELCLKGEASSWANRNLAKLRFWHCEDCFSREEEVEKGRINFMNPRGCEGFSRMISGVLRMSNLISTVQLAMQGGEVE
jgi:hypothetical protein